MVKSSIYLVIISLFVSVFSFFNQLYIAKFFGAGKNLDLFLSCTSLPVLVGALSSITLSYLLTPHLLKQGFKLNTNDNTEYISVLFYSLFKRLVIVVTVLGTISILFFDTIFTTFTDENYKTIVLLLLISWLNTLLSFVFSFVSCYLNSIKSYILPLVLNLTPFLFSIIFINWFSSEYGILTIILGNFVGLIINCVFIIYKSGIKLTFFSSIAIEDQRKFISQLPILILAMLAFTVYQSVDSFWVTKVSPSYLSYLGYGQRILIAIGSLVIIGPSNLMIPMLTESFISSKFDEFYDSVKKIIVITFSLASFVAILCSFFSKQIIFLLLQRGAFTETDTENLGSIMPVLFIGMVFMLSVTIIFRILFVQEKQKVVGLIGVLTFLIYFISCGLATLYGSLTAFAIAYLFTWLIIFGISLLGIYKDNLSLFFNSNTCLLFLKLLGSILITILFLFLQTNFFTINFSNKYISSLFLIGINSAIALLFFIIFTSRIFVILELKQFYNKVFSIFRI